MPSAKSPQSDTEHPFENFLELEEDEYAGLADHAAHAVKLTGNLAGDTIKVSHIVMTERGAGR